MEIIKSMREPTNKEIYELAMSPSRKKVSDFEGVVFKIENYIHYKDVDNTGKEVELLSIKTEDGELMVTNSKTYIQEFVKVVDFFKDDIPSFTIKSSESKNGRKFIYCEAYFEDAQ